MFRTTVGRRRAPGTDRTSPARVLAALVVALVGGGMLPGLTGAAPAQAADGQGFTLNAAD